MIEKELVAVEFKGLFELAPEEFCCALLRNPSDAMLLPIWVSAVSALQLQSEMSGVRRSRPTAHEVLVDYVTETNGGVECVGITDCHEGTFMGALVLEDGSSLDVRASDALIIAAMLESQLLVATDVLEQYAVYVPPEGTLEYFGVEFDDPPGEGEASGETSASGDAQADADFAALMQELGMSEDELQGLRGGSDAGDNESEG